MAKPPDASFSAASESSRAHASDLFVGRERELEQLRAGLHESLAGRGQLFLVSGEPGIGKTRLADELAGLATDRGAEVVWGRCWEGGGAPAYWPWVQVLRALSSDPRRKDLTTILRDRISAVTSDFPEAGRQDANTSRALPRLPSITGLAPEHERFRLFDSLAEALREAADSAALVIILDDCHAADSASLSLLKFVARDLRRSRILILATFRELEARMQPEVSELFSDLEREARVIALRGISESEVSQLLTNASGRAQQAALASTLYHATEGNPFFLSEIVRLLVTEGRIASPESSGLRGFSLPETVRAAIRRRLQLVSSATRAALSAASVIGRQFDLGLLRRVCELADSDLQDALAEAASRALVVEVPEVVDGYRFSNALIPETLSEDLPHRKSRDLHSRIGAVMEDVYAVDLNSHLPEIAYHLVEALPSGDANKAFDYAARAAERADAMLAYEESARLYNLALKAQERGSVRDDRRRCDLLLRLGGSLHACGQFAESRRTFLKAAELAIRLADPLRQASAVLGCATVPSTPGVPDRELITMLEGCLTALGQQDSPARAMVMARLAEELLWSEDSPRRDALSRAAVEIARRAGDERALIEALYRRHITLMGPDTSHDRLALSKEIAVLIRRTGGGDAELRTHYLRIADLLEIGDIAGVDREIAAYLDLIHQLRQPSYGVPDSMLAMRALMDARVDDSEKLALSGFAAVQSRRRSFATQILAAQLTLVRREQGRLGELVPIIRGFTEQYPTLTLARCGLAWCYCETGCLPEAAAEFERLAKGGFGSIQKDATWLVSMAHLAEVCAELCDRVRAGELYALLSPYSALNATIDVYACYGSVAHYLGMLAHTIGDLGRAEEHFEAATQFNLAMGSHLWVARTRYRHVSLLLSRDQPGDLDKAAGLIGLALETCQSFGLEPLAIKLRALDAAKFTGAEAPDGTISLLFSDIEASTIMTEELGDIRAQELISAHRAIIREQVAAYQGFEVKTMGDGFMIAFSSARRALLCAIAIQEAFESYNAENSARPIRVSVGLHTGEAIKEVGDFYGKAVIMASRIGGQARGGEILVSSTFRDLTVTAGDFRFDSGREIPLKGFSGTHRVYSVLWRQDSSSQ